MSANSICKTLSVLVAAMFLANCFAMVSLGDSAAVEEEQTNSVYAEEKTIEVNITIFDDWEGVLSDDNGQTWKKELHYVFEKVTEVRLVPNKTTLLVESNTGQSYNVIAQFPSNFYLKCWGLKDGKQYLTSEKTMGDDVIDVELVLDDAPKGGIGELQDMIKKHIASGTDVMLDKNYMGPGEINVGEMASGKPLVIDLCGYQISNIKFIANGGTLVINDGYGYGAIINSGNPVIEFPPNIQNTAATVILNSGSLIADNEGVVKIGSGQFVMNGGQIRSEGSGVYFKEKPQKPYNVIINGGIIECDDCAICAIGGNITVAGGKITDSLGKTSKQAAVFVAEYANAYLLGGEITNCQGGLFAGSNTTVIMSGTSITKNGFGAFIEDSTFIMNDGEISGNGLSTTGLTTIGAGINANNSVVKISGGAITDNVASGDEAAIYLNNSTLHLSGTPVIKDNYMLIDDDKAIPSNLLSYPSSEDVKTIIDGRLGDGANVFVSLPLLVENDVYFAARNATPYLCSQYFHCDGADYYSLDEENCVVIEPIPPIEHDCGENLTWSLNGDTLVITGEGTVLRKGNWGPIIEQINYVSIPEGVETINGATFANFTQLKEITIPKTVKAIGEMAFIDCPSVEKIVFEGGEVGLGKGSFDLKGNYLPQFTTGASNGSGSITVVSENNWAEDAFTENVIGETYFGNFVFEGGSDPGPEPTPSSGGSSGTDIIVWVVILAALALVLIVTRVKK